MVDIDIIEVLLSTATVVRSPVVDIGIIKYCYHGPQSRSGFRLEFFK